MVTTQTCFIRHRQIDLLVLPASNKEMPSNVIFRKRGRPSNSIYSGSCARSIEDRNLPSISSGGNLVLSTETCTRQIEATRPNCVSYSYTVRACLIVTVHGSISCTDPLRPARRSTYPKFCVLPLIVDSKRQGCNFWQW